MELIYKLLGWDSDESKSSLILIDQGYAEYLKWQFGTVLFTKNCSILPYEDFIGLTEWNEFKADRVSILISSSLTDSLTQINCTLKNLSFPKEVVIVTVCSSDSCKTVESVERETSTPTAVDYESIKSRFQDTENIRIVHLPLHVIPLLSSREKQKCDLFILSSASCRSLFPIKLSSVINSQSKQANADRESFKKSIDNISAITAADISTDISHQLKVLSRELSASIVCNLGLDPTGNIFSFGKTSSLVGFSAQTYIASEVEQFTKLPESVKQFVRLSSVEAATATAVATAVATATLKPATLLLIDRTQDLLSPLRHVGENESNTSSTVLNHYSCLGHRIFSTLRNSSRTNSDTSCLSYGSHTRSGSNNELNTRRFISCDVEVHPANYSNASNSKDKGSDVISAAESELERLSSVLSAVRGLAFPLLLPTICIDALCRHSRYISALAEKDSEIAEAINKLQFNLFGETEESFKLTLCKLLRLLITVHRGTIPPAKKRGLGAEVLGLLQSLLQSNSVSSTISIAVQPYFEEFVATNKYDISVCMKCLPIMSLASAVVDSMQRSNSKQLANVCNWLCSYDNRSAREAVIFGELLTVLQFEQQQRQRQSSTDVRSCLDNQLKLLAQIAISSSAAAAESKADLKLDAKSAAKSNSAAVRAEDSGLLEGPVDLLHVLMLLAAIVGIVGFDLLQQSKEFPALKNALKGFIINHCCAAELVMLSRYRLLTIELVADILNSRQPSGPIDDEEDREGLRLRVDLEVDDVLEHVFEEVLQDIHSSRLVPMSGDYIADISSSGSVGSGVSSSGGVLSRTVEALMLARLPSTSPASLLKDMYPDSLTKMTCYEHIETPIQQLKRAGLGLLSHGLGRLGFSGPNIASSRPSASSMSCSTANIIIFVIGGISLKEVSEIQQVIHRHYDTYAGDEIKIFLGSTCLASDEVLLKQLFAL